VDSAEERKDTTGVNPWKLHGSVRELWKHDGNKDGLASKAKKRSYSDVVTAAQSAVMKLKRRLIASGVGMDPKESKSCCSIFATQV